MRHGSPDKEFLRLLEACRDIVASVKSVTSLSELDGLRQCSRQLDEVLSDVREALRKEENQRLRAENRYRTAARLIRLIPVVAGLVIVSLAAVHRGDLMIYAVVGTLLAVIALLLFRSISLSASDVLLSVGVPVGLIGGMSLFPRMRELLADTAPAATWISLLTSVAVIMLAIRSNSSHG